jgi:hypothetical protein
MKAQTTRLAAILAGGLLVVAVACDESETVAPDGSTITLNANPAQVIQDDAGTQIVDVVIVATVRNSIGVPLPGQDVRFTTNSGVLTPPGNTPVETDDIGNASCVLTDATVGPQITATSGKATANITLSAAKGEVSTITLDISPDSDLDNCADDFFDLTATARASDGTPVEGLQINFEFTTTGDENFTGDFNPDSDVTDAMGIATTKLTPNPSTCSTKCEPTGMSCTSRIRARGGLIVSDEFEIVDQIN